MDPQALQCCQGGLHQSALSVFDLLPGIVIMFMSILGGFFLRVVNFERNNVVVVNTSGF